MKKITFLLSSALCLSSFIGISQTIVNTNASNKHVIFEEFTGVKCGNCPAGHTEAANIASANPGTVHIIAYGPSNSSYTDPTGTNGTDFRRPFANAFYTASYCSPQSGSRFMPSAFINRKLIGGNILQSRSGGVWTNNANSTLTESSPMNVGIKSTYNSSAQTLTIDVEVYYTSTVTDANALYVMITEDNLTSGYQSGSSATVSNPYVYKHTFRENVSTNQWGDPITGGTSQGTLYTTQYVFNLSGAVDPINIANAHVVAFVVNSSSSNKEIYTGISAQANGGQASTGAATSIDELNSTIKLKLYPNPSNGNVNITFNEDVNQVEIFNVLGESVYSYNIENNEKSLNLSKENFKSSGVYFVKVSNKTSSTTERLIIH